MRQALRRLGRVTTDTIIPLVAFSLLLIYYETQGPLLAWARGQSLGNAPALQVANGLLVTAFYLLVLGAVVLRKAPRGRRAPWFEAAVAMFGSFVLVLALPLLHGPRAAPALQGLSDAVVATGLAVTVWGLAYLRLNFSIVPQLRGLSLGGPYRWVRHPMYLGEIVTAAGIVLFAPAPAQLFCLVIFAAAQIGRIHFEERRLAEAYPEYRSHQARSWRLVPFLY